MSTEVEIFFQIFVCDLTCEYYLTVILVIHVKSTFNLSILYSIKKILREIQKSKFGKIFIYNLRKKKKPNFLKLIPELVNCAIYIHGQWS